MEEKPKVTTIPEIPDIPEEKVTYDHVYYHGFYGVIYFNEEDGVDRK